MAKVTIMDENREDTMLLGVLEVSIDVVRLSQDSQAGEGANKTLWWTVFFLGTGTLVGWNRLVQFLVCRTKICQHWNTRKTHW
jgi:hypothetical protein